MANIDVDQLKRVLSVEKTRAAADAGRLRSVNRALRRVRPGPDFRGAPPAGAGAGVPHRDAGRGPVSR
ncbi:hypothetical protein GCM10027605_53440 [Micromonospora zhanjiangensis]